MSSPVQRISTAGVKHPSLNRALSFLYRHWIVNMGKTGTLTEHDMMAMYKNFLGHQFPTFKDDTLERFAIVTTRVMIHMKLVKYDSQSMSFIASADAVAEYSLVLSGNMFIVFADGQELYDALNEASSYYYNNSDDRSRVDKSYWYKVRGDSHEDVKQEAVVSKVKRFKDLTGQLVEYDDFVRQPEVHNMLSVFYNVWKSCCKEHCALRIAAFKKMFRSYFKTKFPNKSDSAIYMMSVLASDVMINLNMVNFYSSTKRFYLNLEAVKDYDLDEPVVKESDFLMFYVNLHKVHSACVRKDLSLASSEYFDSLPLEENKEDEDDYENYCMTIPKPQIVSIERDRYRYDVVTKDRSDDKDGGNRYQRVGKRNPNPKLVSAYADEPFFKHFLSKVTHHFREAFGNSRMSLERAIIFYQNYYNSTLVDNPPSKNDELADKTVLILFNLGILDYIQPLDNYWMNFGVIRDLDLPKDDPDEKFKNLSQLHRNVDNVYEDLNNKREVQEGKNNKTQDTSKSNGDISHHVIHEGELKNKVHSLEKTVDELKLDLELNKYKTESLTHQVEMLKSQLELMNIKLQNTKQ